MSRPASGKQAKAKSSVKPANIGGPLAYTFAFSSDLKENLRIKITAMEVPLSHPPGEEFYVTAQVFDSGRALMPVPIRTGRSRLEPPRYQNKPPGYFTDTGARGADGLDDPFGEYSESESESDGDGASSSDDGGGEDSDGDQRAWRTYLDTIHFDRDGLEAARRAKAEAEAAAGAKGAHTEVVLDAKTQAKVDKAGAKGKAEFDRKEKAKKILAEEIAKLDQQIQEQSATVIATTFRGTKARADFKKGMAAKKAIAETERQLKDAAATKVQSSMRTKFARSAVANKKQEMAEKEKSATAIQAIYRGGRDRAGAVLLSNASAEEKEKAAATMFQAMWRGVLARKAYNEKYLAVARKELEEHAAKYVQALVRQFLAKCQMKRIRAKRDRELAAIEKMEEAAAIKLQCAWRGRLARKKCDALRDVRDAKQAELDKLEEEAAAKKEAAALAFLNDKEKKAAMLIQGLFRRWKARKRVAERRFQKQYRDREAQKKKDAEKKAAAKVVAEKKAREEKAAQAKAAKEAKAEAKAAAAAAAAAGATANAAAAAAPASALVRASSDVSSSANVQAGGVEVFRGDWFLRLRRPRPGGGVAIAQAFEDSLGAADLHGVDPTQQPLEDVQVYVEVSVVEHASPYELRFEVTEPNAAVAHHCTVTVATLERLLLPAFNAPEAGGDGLSAALDSDEVRNAMRAWVTTGQVPQRKYVVRWLLDRMWMRERPGAGVELVLGYAHAGGRPGRVGTGRIA